MEHSSLSFAGEEHKQSLPSSRGSLGTPFACAGLQNRDGGIGLVSRNCSCSPPGSLSACPVSAAASIKHYCSQPRNCQGNAGWTASRLTASGTPRVPSHTHTDAHRCKQSEPGPCQKTSQREPLTPGCPSGHLWGLLVGVGMDGHPHWV